MLSRTYEHLPRSEVLKYFDVTDTNSILPFLTLNKHPAAATFEESVVRISSSSGCGTVSQLLLIATLFLLWVPI
jgi:chaperonin GroEL (HSP60 family)